MYKMRLRKLHKGHCIKTSKFKDIDLLKNGEGCKFFEQSNIEKENRETMEEILLRIKKNLRDIVFYLKNKDC